MQIEIKCETKDQLSLEQLTDFQGDLKELSSKNYEKLKKQIIENGFIVPFFVWYNKNKNINYILDGHQRKTCIERMKKDKSISHVVFPDAFPVVFIDAKNEKDAKKKLLAINSQYGKMTEKGFLNFISDIEIPFDDILNDFEFPIIDLNKIKEIQESLNKSDYSEDKLEEIPDTRETNIKIGDMFNLGKHKLLCGDATNIEHVKMLMQADMADLVFTDPPYGVKYKGGTKEKLEIKNDGKEFEQVWIKTLENYK